MAKGGITVKGTTGAEEMLERLKNHKPVLEKFKGIFADPNTYTRPDRLVGGAGKPGEISTWAPGYVASKRRVKVKKKALQVSHSRPFHPMPTEATDLRITEAMAEYVVAGKLP